MVEGQHRAAGWDLVGDGSGRGVAGGGHAWWTPGPRGHASAGPRGVLGGGSARTPLPHGEGPAGSARSAGQALGHRAISLEGDAATR